MYSELERLSPFVQAVAETVAPGLRIEPDVLNVNDPNLAFKVWKGGLRLRDFVLFDAEVPVSSKQQLIKFLVNEFRVYLAPLP